MAHSLSDFASRMAKGVVAVEIWKHHELEDACKIVEEEAKRVIGTYDYNWPHLAESTQEQRVRLGYAADEPLLRTDKPGDIKHSIEHTVEHDAGYVGSNNKIAAYQELGTRKIPPRSFLAGAAMHKEHEIHEEISHGVHVAIAVQLGVAALPKKP